MTSEPEPIRSQKLSALVQERLLDLIRTEGLAPGAILPSERELMRRHQVGRPAIREAMQGLQRMGVVEIKHGGRPKVAKPSMNMLIGQMTDSMQHLLTHSATTMEYLKDARVTFEAEMARIAARRRTDADVLELHDILKKQAAYQTEPVKFIEIDGMFHKRIATIANNPIFESVSQAMFNWLSLFRSDMVGKRGLEKLTLSEHRGIVDAIEQGDENLAGQLMMDHIARANTLYNQQNLRD